MIDKIKEILKKDLDGEISRISIICCIILIITAIVNVLGNSAREFEEFTTANEVAGIEDNLEYLKNEIDFTVGYAENLTYIITNREDRMALEVTDCVKIIQEHMQESKGMTKVHVNLGKDLLDNPYEINATITKDKVTLLNSDSYEGLDRGEVNLSIFAAVLSGKCKLSSISTTREDIDPYEKYMYRNGGILIYSMPIIYRNEKKGSIVIEIDTVDILQKISSKGSISDVFYLVDENGNLVERTNGEYTENFLKDQYETKNLKKANYILNMMDEKEGFEYYVNAYGKRFLVVGRCIRVLDNKTWYCVSANEIPVYYKTQFHQMGIAILTIILGSIVLVCIGSYMTRTVPLMIYDRSREILNENVLRIGEATKTEMESIKKQLEEDHAKYTEGNVLDVFKNAIKSLDKNTGKKETINMIEEISGLDEMNNQDEDKKVEKINMIEEIKR